MIYELKNANFTAQVDSLGAQLISLKGKNGFEYLWTADPNYWGEHAPILFPIVGAIRDNKVKIGGDWFEMGRHGFAKKMEFSLVEQAKEKISLRLASDFETKKFYPFEFSLTVTYTLTEQGVDTAFSVENRGDKVLPFVIGGHPGFNLPVNEAAKFEDYTIVFEKPENQKCPTIETETSLINYTKNAFVLENEQEIPLQHSLFYNDALVFDQLNSHTVKIVNKASGKGVEMEFSSFSMLGIWSARNDGPYVCLEPWTGCATLTTEGDEFEKKKNMASLPAGATAGYSFSVRIL